MNERVRPVNHQIDQPWWWLMPWWLWPWCELAAAGLRTVQDVLEAMSDRERDG